MLTFSFIFFPLHSSNSSIPLLYKDCPPWFPSFLLLIPRILIRIPSIPTRVPRIPTLIPYIPTLILCIPIIPTVPTLISDIPTLILGISITHTLIPRIPTVIPCIHIIPLIQFPDSLFQREPLTRVVDFKQEAAIEVYIYIYIYIYILNKTWLFTFWIFERCLKKYFTNDKKRSKSRSLLFEIFTYMAPSTRLKRQEPEICSHYFVVPQRPLRSLHRVLLNIFRVVSKWMERLEFIYYILLFI